MDEQKFPRYFIPAPDSMPRRHPERFAGTVAEVTKHSSETGFGEGFQIGHGWKLMRARLWDSLFLLEQGEMVEVTEEEARAIVARLSN